jgi:hypothetical protein
MINDAVKELDNSPSIFHYFQKKQGRGNLATLENITHPAKRLLRHIGVRGAPVVIQTAPWTAARKNAAVSRGLHKSAHEFQEFLREEMADMVEKAIWAVFPYHKVKHLKNLRVSSIGIVPQHERRPRPIVDYTFSNVNSKTLKLAPREVMQFGRALERIITRVVRADPRFGPVKFIKIDLADGFYRVHVRAEDIPKLGIAFPSLIGEEALIAFPLALPMGWTESPPYFCAVTETIANVANRRILKWRHPCPHKLDRLASSTPGVEPSVTSPSYDALLATTVAETLPLQRDPLLQQRQRILASINVFVDDSLAQPKAPPVASTGSTES